MILELTDPRDIGNIEIYEWKSEEIWNKGNLDVVDEVIAPDYVDHYGGIEGQDEYRAVVAAFREAFPNLHFEIRHLFDVEDDMVAGHWTMSGTHEGEYFGEPPTGNNMEVPGLDNVRFQNGQIIKTGKSSTNSASWNS